MQKSFLTSVRVAASAVLTAVGLGVAATPAIAQPALPPLPELPPVSVPGIGPIEAPHNGGVKQVVAFGDSFTAAAGKGGTRGLEAGQTPWVANCATDMENWPKEAARHLDKSIGDWSCNGTGGMPILQLKAYVESAIWYGDIGPGTEKVVLMYGGMDAIQWVDVAGQINGTLPDTNPTVYRQLVADVANRIREATNGTAEVVLTSYPELANNDTICLANPPGTTMPIPAPGATQIQEALRDNIASAANFAGARFIDVYQATLGHGSCTPDPNQRWVVGTWDPDAPSTMPNHPTIIGEKEMGRIIAEQLYA